MLISATEKWIHGVVVPNRGIFYRPRSAEVICDDDSAIWLIENGFATSAEPEVPESPKPKRSPTKTPHSEEQ
jgi:hypothetical protein